MLPGRNMAHGTAFILRIVGRNHPLRKVCGNWALGEKTWCISPIFCGG
jgi:hypothetical protein